MDPYMYLPLPSDGFHIRLVKIIEAEDNTNPIRCAITTHLLSECPDYDAISYSWGDSDDQTQVFCDEKSISVPSNLSACLLRFRVKKLRTKGPFWVDSICINQSDIAEKNSQVLEMRNIYRRAKRTIIWLGEEDEKSTAGMQFALKLSNNLTAAMDESKKSMLHRLRSFREVPSAFSPKWEAFFSLFERSWFKRAWVVQEVALSKDAWVVCGEPVITWSGIVRALFYLQIYHTWILEFHGSGNVEVLHALYITQREVADKVETKHYEILVRHRKSMATNPIDKIFAFYGLSSQRSFDKHHIMPDYGAKTAKVFTDVAMATLNNAENLDFLSVPRLDRDANSLKMPSWVPDWSSSGPNCSSLLQFETAKPGPDKEVPKLPYFASSNSTCTVTISDENTRLNVSGYIVDRLDDLSDHWVLQDTTGYQTIRHQTIVLQQNQRLLYNWMSITESLRAANYPTGESYDDVLCHCYTSGQFTDYEKFDVRRLYRGFQKRQRYLRLIQRFNLVESLWPWFIFVLIGHVLRMMGIANPEMGFRTLTGNVTNRRIARTMNGYAGLVPRIAQEGDYVVLLKGGKLPFILRPRGKEWELIGDAYVHGMARGELWNQEKCGDMRLV